MIFIHSETYSNFGYEINHLIFNYPYLYYCTLLLEVFYYAKIMVRVGNPPMYLRLQLKEDKHHVIVCGLPRIWTTVTVGTGFHCPIMIIILI